MTLYEINSQIEQLISDNIDAETGEILNPERLDELQLDRDSKIESIALAYKNAMSDAAQLKEEKDAFYERQKRSENRAESLKKYLSSQLNGEKFETPKVSINFRTSEKIEIDDVKLIPSKYLNYADPTADKMAIKAAMKSGKTFPGVTVHKNINIIIK